MSGISLFAVMAVGILFMGLFVWLLVLVIRALRKYIRSEPARSEAAAVKRSLGETIRARRTACKMTQEFVAETVGVSRQAVSKWESGTSEPSTSNLLALARLFGISAEELLREVDGPGQKQEEGQGEPVRPLVSAKRRKARRTVAPVGPSGDGGLGAEQLGVHAGVVENILLGDAGVFAEILRGNAGQQRHGALHPHVEREAFGAVQAVEQRAVRDLRADAEHRLQGAARFVERQRAHALEVERAGGDAAGGVDQILRAKALHAARPSEMRARPESPCRAACRAALKSP